MYDTVLKLILSADRRRPASTQPPALDPLFARLADPDLRDAHETEDAIWAMWTGHSDAEAAQRMERAIAAIARRQHDIAETHLSRLVEAHPDYAEAWNKCATLLFVLKRDGESVADIERVLRLEPRHFGAMCGFAQICLRAGDRAGALATFETALAINPHMASVRQAVEELRRGFSRRVH